MKSPHDLVFAAKQTVHEIVIADAPAAALAWCARHKAVPVNHLVVVSEALSRERPEQVREVYRLLGESKARGPGVAPGATNFFPFGVEACRPSLQIIIEYAYNQGLLARRLTVDEFFDETTRALG